MGGVHVSRLREALMEVPDDWTVSGNALGNLTLWNTDGEFVGWVDMRTGEVAFTDVG